jgi:hypothetical protein
LFFILEWLRVKLCKVVGPVKTFGRLYAIAVLKALTAFCCTWPKLKLALPIARATATPFTLYALVNNALP